MFVGIALVGTPAKPTPPGLDEPPLLPVSASPSLSSPG
jgi:hypothetical protein